MRTTVKIDDRLLAEAKSQAAKSGRTLNAVIEDALRASLANRQRGSDRRNVDLPTFRGSQLLPGVDLDDSAALLERMEGPET
jgi:hypothetical protein